MSRKTIIHLSDLHISRRPKEGSQARKIIKAISLSWPGTPVLITGDIVNSATERQFKEARSLLDGLARTNPVLMVPGNHDYAWKGSILRSDGWDNWVETLGTPLGWGRSDFPWMGVDHDPVGVDGLGVVKNGPCVYFGLDSGDPDDKEISARGYISKTLADALNACLLRYVGKTRVVFLHHHPFTEGVFTKLHGSQRLLNATRDNCELLLFGHKHDYGIWWDSRGIPLIVSSHKSTNWVSGKCLMITMIDICRPGTSNVSFRHRLEVV
jgi:3',5'-cyclic AMP phosphodiesterase CpdA